LLYESTIICGVPVENPVTFVTGIEAVPWATAVPGAGRVKVGSHWIEMVFEFTAAVYPVMVITEGVGAGADTVTVVVRIVIKSITAFGWGRPIVNLKLVAKLSESAGIAARANEVSL
jgi:hypothetical protein